ncbi:EamA family transporter [Desulfonema ishimotonii]|uniref:EamA family transporter n=2 Tax=Desulfonema ishimotonii TaxID=45657 RepID=A0A401FZ25_9BACT|nr:EamA family transporter [Desulfonema ishimotonii]
MYWFILSLLTALAVSSQDACVKRFFSGLSPFEMAACPLFYSLPMLAVAAPFIPVPPVGPDFGWTFLLSIPMNGISFILYMRAIRESPLSLTIPYLAFTPVFMILTGYLFLGEMPSPTGILGILVICAGGYTLNIDPARWHILFPIRAVFRETGSWLMLIVAFLYSFTSVIGKKAILNSSPLFFSILFFGVFNLLMLFLLRIMKKIRFATFLAHPVNGSLAGTLFFLHILFHGWAISMTKAAYMISVKRLSVLFSIIYGKFIFREERIAIRLGGALLMLAGTLLITLQGD